MVGDTSLFTAVAKSDQGMRKTSGSMAASFEE
eukprot:SAG31_NODE_18088_length_647_cov_1.114964_1_plen_31_part_10